MLQKESLQRPSDIEKVRIRKNTSEIQPIVTIFYILQHIPFFTVYIILFTLWNFRYKEIKLYYDIL